MLAKRHSSCLAWIVLIILACCLGCSRPPAVQFDHLPLIASLRTACSARNPDWLAGVKKAVDERHAAAKMTGDEVYLVFGPETRSIPPSIIDAERCLRIPMLEGGTRSLNLATAAAIVLYEAVRQRAVL